MRLEDFMSTKERIKILNEIIYKTNLIGVNSTSRNVGLSKGLVSKYFQMLAKHGIIKKKEGKFFVKAGVQTKTLKILLNLNLFDVDIFSRYRFVESAGLYGSLAKGTNTENSDIDLWILVNNEKDLPKLTADLKKNFGNIKPLYLTKEKVNILKKEDKVFYYSLIFGSIIVYGDGIEGI